MVPSFFSLSLSLSLSLVVVVCFVSCFAAKVLATVLLRKSLVSYLFFLFQAEAWQGMCVLKVCVPILIKNKIRLKYQETILYTIYTISLVYFPEKIKQFYNCFFICFSLVLYKFYFYSLSLYPLQSQLARRMNERTHSLLCFWLGRKKLLRTSSNKKLWRLMTKKHLPLFPHCLQ